MNAMAMTDSPLARAVTTAQRPLLVVLFESADAQTVSWLLAQPQLAAVLLAGANDALHALAPARVGWFPTDAPSLLPSNRDARDALYVGSHWNLTVQRVLALRDLGITRVAGLGETSVGARLPLGIVLAASVLRGIGYRLTVGAFARLLRRLEGVRIRRTCERLRARVPVTTAPADTQPILLVTGSLGSGGSERQVANTICGLAGLRDDGGPPVALVVRHPLAPPLDFYLPQIAATGTEVQTLRPLAARTANVLAPCADAVRTVRGFPGSTRLTEEIVAWMGEFIERRPAVVHCWLDHVNVTAGVAAVLCGVPRVVIGCRSMAPTHFDFHQPYMQPLYALLGACPQVRFAANSAAGAADYAAWIGVDVARFAIVRNGFDLTALRRTDLKENAAAALRRELGIAPSAPVVAGVLRLSEEKRPLLWLESACAVLERAADAHFIVAGDGPLRDAMREEARARGVDARLHLLGQRRDVDTVLCTSDVLLLTSRMEGLPNVLIEAQAHGVPVVCTGVGGAGETVLDGRTGLVCADDAPGTLATAVLRLLDDPAWRARVRADGPAWVEQTFSLATMLAHTAQIYGLPALAHAAAGTNIHASR